MRIFEQLMTQEQINKDVRKERFRRNLSSLKAECIRISAVALGMIVVIVFLAN